MRYTINQVTSGEDELILNYREFNPEVEAAIAYIERHQKKLQGKCDGEIVIFSPEDILYIEKVDEKTFAYTLNQVIQLNISLSTAEMVIDDISFFRCSKSMIVNINMVERLRSMPSNRIDVTLVSGEHIIISRTYASDFRRLLRNE